MKLAGGRLNNGSNGGDRKRMGERGSSGKDERLVDGKGLREGLSCERKRGGNWGREDERLVSQSYWSRDHGWLHQDRRDSQDGSSGNSIAGLDRLGLAPPSLRHGSDLSLGGLVSGKMFGSSSGNFRGLLHGERGNQGGGHRDLRGHGQTNSSGSRDHGHVGGGHSEAVDIVSSVVDSLHHVVGIHVLVAASGHSESVL